MSLRKKSSNVSAANVNAPPRWVQPYPVRSSPRKHGRRLKGLPQCRLPLTAKHDRSHVDLGLLIDPSFKGIQGLVDGLIECVDLPFHRHAAALESSRRMTGKRRSNMDVIKSCSFEFHQEMDSNRLCDSAANHSILHLAKLLEICGNTRSMVIGIDALASEANTHRQEFDEFDNLLGVIGLEDGASFRFIDKIF